MYHSLLVVLGIGLSLWNMERALNHGGGWFNGICAVVGGFGAGFLASALILN